MIGLIYEYYPLQKMISVPNGKAAFLRRPYGNMGTVVYWKNDTPENNEYGRKAAFELTSIVSEGQLASSKEMTCYGNFGE